MIKAQQAERAPAKPRGANRSDNTHGQMRTTHHLIFANGFRVFSTLLGHLSRLAPQQSGAVDSADQEIKFIEVRGRALSPRTARGQGAYLPPNPTSTTRTPAHVGELND